MQANPIKPNSVKRTLSQVSIDFVGINHLKVCRTIIFPNRWSILFLYIENFEALMV